MDAILMVHSNERLVKNKIGLLNLAEELRSIAKFCKRTGLFRAKKKTPKLIREKNAAAEQQ